MKFPLLFAMVLFGITGTTEASMPPPPGALAGLSAPAVVPAENTAVKRGFLERIVEKTWYKRLKKMAKNSGRSGGSYGTGLAIWGLVLGLLGICSFIFIYYTAFYLPLALGLAGLTLSIWALVKSRGWQDNKLAHRLAIAGIVINALVVISAIALVGSF